MQPTKIINEDNPLDTSVPIIQESQTLDLSTTSGSLTAQNNSNTTIMYIAIAIAVVVILGLIAVIIKSHKAKKAAVFIKPSTKKPAAAKLK